MKYYVGLDVSMKETCICIIDEVGKVVYEKSVLSDPSTIAECIKKANLLIEKVGLETGCISNWLTSQLILQGLPAICVDARHIAAILSMTVNKTDRNDARGIANAIRCGLYRESTLKTQSNIEISTILTARRGLVRQKTALKNTLRGILKAYGIRINISGNKKFIVVLREAIKTCSHFVIMSTESLLTIFEALDEEIEKLDKQLKEISKEDSDITLLKSIPGVGLITAINFKAALGDPSRFSKSKTVGAYFGITPTQYSSGEISKQGRISKCGSSEMRSLLVEAATVLLTRTTSWSKLKAWGLKIARKKGMKKAFVAVARKLAVIMHRMLITKEPFRFTDKEEKEFEKKEEIRKEKIAV